MGRWKAFIPIILALVIAAGGSGFLYNWLKAKSAPAAVVKVEAESEAVPVVVTTSDITWGQQLTKEMLKTVPFMKESLPVGYASDPDALVGRVVISALKEQEPVLESRLASKDVTTGGVGTGSTPRKDERVLEMVAPLVSTVSWSMVFLRANCNFPSAAANPSLSACSGSTSKV